LGCSSSAEQTSQTGTIKRRTGALGGVPAAVQNCPHRERQDMREGGMSRSGRRRGSCRGRP
jgi:hypothetical protein